MSAEVITPLAALIAGAVTGLHCIGMCGPLACSMRAPPIQYHASRMISYAIVGALMGAIGLGFSEALQSGPMRLAPWAMVVVLMFIALGWERRFPRPPGLWSWLVRIRLRRTLGLLTPLIPCGPLWMMAGVAALSASPVEGGMLMAVFAAGTIPVFGLFQFSLRHMQARLNPVWVTRSQRGLAGLAACVVAWRASLPIDACCH